MAANERPTSTLLIHGAGSGPWVFEGWNKSFLALHVRAVVVCPSLAPRPLLQRSWEVSKDYAMFAIPVAYLIDEQGTIAEDVAVGSDAILALV